MAARSRRPEYPSLGQGCQDQPPPSQLCLPLELHTQLKLQSISPPVPPCRTTNKSRHPPRNIYSPIESIPKQTSIKPRHFIPECHHFGGRHELGSRVETPPAAAHWWSYLIGKVRAQTLVSWAINVDWRVDSLAYTRRQRLLGGKSNGWSNSCKII